MSPSEFTEEMLGVVRREFYPAADPKKFFRDRAFLMRAITQPAAWLKKRGATLPMANYRRILWTVIETIKTKGAGRDEIGYFPRYLLHCVQTHMEHHGERYYYAGKALDGRSVSARQVSDVVARELKALGRAGQGDQTVPVMAEVHRALTTRGRIQKGKKGATELELPGLCKTSAKTAGIERDRSRPLS
jgi:hypothetical protein